MVASVARSVVSPAPASAMADLLGQLVYHLLDPPAFALPVMVAHLALEPMQSDRPTELAALLWPLRRLMRPLNRRLTPEQLRAHCALRPSQWRERPYTLVTHMFWHADNSHVIGNLLSALSAGRAVSEAATPTVAHMVFWCGGAFAALDPLGLAQLQLERRSARVVAGFLSPFAGGSSSGAVPAGSAASWEFRPQSPSEWADNVGSSLRSAMGWAGAQVAAAAEVAGAVAGADRRICVGSSGGCFALASFQLCAQVGV